MPLTTAGAARADVPRARIERRVLVAFILRRYVYNSVVRLGSFQPWMRQDGGELTLERGWVGALF